MNLSAQRPVPKKTPSVSFADPESMLMDDLMRVYDRRLRPDMSKGRPVTIHMTIVLAILTELVIHCVLTGLKTM